MYETESDRRASSGKSRFLFHFFPPESWSTFDWPFFVRSFQMNNLWSLKWNSIHGLIIYRNLIDHIQSRRSCNPGLVREEFVRLKLSCHGNRIVVEFEVYSVSLFLSSPKSPAEREKLTDERIIYKQNPSTLSPYSSEYEFVPVLLLLLWETMFKQKNHFITINMLNNRHRCRCCLLSCTQEWDSSPIVSKTRWFSVHKKKERRQRRRRGKEREEKNRQQSKMMSRRWQNYVFELLLKLTFIGFIFAPLSIIGRFLSLFRDDPKKTHIEGRKERAKWHRQRRSHHFIIRQ